MVGGLTTLKTIKGTKKSVNWKNNNTTANNNNHNKAFNDREEDNENKWSSNGQNGRLKKKETLIRTRNLSDVG